mgnify:CR=1 FL=1
MKKKAARATTKKSKKFKKSNYTCEVTSMSPFGLSTSKLRRLGSSIKTDVNTLVSFISDNDNNLNLQYNDWIRDIIDRLQESAQRVVNFSWDPSGPLEESPETEFDDEY